MNKRLNCILLVDDNEADNFFHRIVLEEMSVTKKIHVVENGIEAMDYLRNNDNQVPELIFLDINMPRMNGWELLEAYSKFNDQRKAKIIIEMLTTSSNPDDLKRASLIPEVSGYTVKPLSAEMVSKILEKFFA